MTFDKLRRHLAKSRWHSGMLFGLFFALLMAVLVPLLAPIATPEEWWIYCVGIFVEFLTMTSLYVALDYLGFFKPPYPAQRVWRWIRGRLARR